jgi:hypothetical protein
VSPIVPASKPKVQRVDDLEGEFIRKFGRAPTEQEKKLLRLADAALTPSNQESDTA